MIRDLVALGIGVLITFAIMISVPGTVTYSGNKAIKDCEAMLPRNQYCVLTAVPQEPTE